MARPRSKIDITCQNPNCKYYLTEDGKDILKRGRNKAGNQQYYCNYCHSWFVETANTPLYHKHLPRQDIILICQLLVEKNSIRSIERITGHHRDTICHLLDDLALHADYANDILLKDISLGQFEVDEFWSTIKKSRKRLNQVIVKKEMSGSTHV